MPSGVDAIHESRVENRATSFGLEGGVRGRAMNIFSMPPNYSRLPVFSNPPPCDSAGRECKGQAPLGRAAVPRAPVMAKSMSTENRGGSRFRPGNEPIPGNILLSEILALLLCAKSEAFAVKKVSGFLPGVFHKKMFKEI